MPRSIHLFSPIPQQCAHRSLTTSSNFDPEVIVRDDRAIYLDGQEQTEAFAFERSGAVVVQEKERLQFVAVLYLGVDEIIHGHHLLRHKAPGRDDLGRDELAAILQFDVGSDDPVGPVILVGVVGFLPQEGERCVREVPYLNLDLLFVRDDLDGKDPVLVYEVLGQDRDGSCGTSSCNETAFPA